MGIPLVGTGKSWLAGANGARHGLRMGPLDYLTGMRFNLVSPLSPAEVKERLRSASGSKFNPISMGVKARIFGNRIKLRWKVPLVSDWLSPVFVGKIEDEMGRTRFRAKFVPSLRARMFLIVCSFIACFALLGFASALASGEIRTDADLYFLLLVAGLFAAPVVVQALSNLTAKSNLGDMISFLERAAEFRIDDATRD